jgi:AraC-like DNA-binding protein
MALPSAPGSARVDRSASRRVLVLGNSRAIGHTHRRITAIIAAVQRRGWRAIPMDFFPGTRWLPQADAAIAIVATPEMRSVLGSWGSPVVDIDDSQDHGWPRVTVDPVATARLAFAHLQARGARAIATMGNPQRRFSRSLGSGLDGLARAAGMAALHHDVHPSWRSWDCTAAIEAEAHRRLAGFLRGLPTRTGVVVWSENTAVDIQGAMESMGPLREDLLFMAAGDDPELLGPFGITGISRDAVAQAEATVAAAHRLLRNRAGPAHVLLPPDAVEVRRSTAMANGSEPAMVRLLDHIQDHPERSLRLADLADLAGMHPRTLVRRFTAMVGRGPLAEHRRLRLRLARELADQGLDRDLIARRCGYADRASLDRVLRRIRATGPGRP